MNNKIPVSTLYEIGHDAKLFGQEIIDNRYDANRIIINEWIIQARQLVDDLKEIIQNDMK